MTDDDRLVQRALNAVPACSYAMHALLSLLRVEASRDVPTAAVSCERRPVLRINPDFARQRCRTDEHLFLLVMHELYHVLLGHTRLFPRATPAHNLAFDAVINSLLVLQHPGRAYSSFFLDLYGGEHGAMRLLAPPDGKGLADPALGALHRLLYDAQGKTTSEEIFAQLTRTIESDVDATGLLGSHGHAPAGREPDEDRWGAGGPLDPAVVDAIREIVERWPKPEGERRGRSLSDVLQVDAVSPAPVGRQVLAVVRRALTAASLGRHAAGRRATGVVPGQVPIPDRRDRRGVVLAASGRAPLLYDSVVHSVRAKREGQARVYLDVSGSMDAYLPCLYAALAALRDHIEPKVALFSTTVVTVLLADVVRGRKDTTGGTSIDCVVADLLSARPRKALLMTDGHVGEIDRRDRTRLESAGVEVRVLLTPGGWREHLAPVASRFDELPPLDAGTWRVTSRASGALPCRGGSA